MSESRSVAIIGTKKKAELPADLFDVQTNIPLIHQVVVAQLAAARQGTHATKTRGDVRGGGVVHGPQPRDYAQRTPKKMVAAALRGVLSDRARDERLHVIDTFVKGDKPSTKAALQALESIAGKRVLVVLTRDEEIAWLSLRNVASVHLITPDQLNAYDVVVADDVVFSAAALDAFVAGPAKGKSVKAVATESEVEETEK